MLRPTRVSVPGSAFRFAYGAFTLFDRLSQHRSATESVCNSPIPLRQVPDRPHNTPCATPAGLTRKRFRLYPFRSPLLRASLRFLLLRLLRCFTSPGDRLIEATGLNTQPGFPIRKSADQWSLAPPRSLSQLATSFFGRRRLGIPRVPLIP